MSRNNSKKKGGNICLFFNRHLNIFPDDFFVTKNKKLIILKNPYNDENSKNEINIADNISNKINNNTTTNFRKSIKKLSNIIKFENINKTRLNKFSFKEKDARSRFIKSKSLSDLDDEKNNEPNPYLRNQFSSRKNLNNNKKYYMNIYDNNGFQNINIQSNELFRESGAKYKGSNKETINNKYKKDIKINIYKSRYIKTEISKLDTSQSSSKPKTAKFITRKLNEKITKDTKKLLKITNSSEFDLKYPKIKQHMKNNKYILTESDDKQKMNFDLKIFNKRISSSNKQNIKTKIKNTIDNIFVELSKNYEDNKDILDKFNSLIKDVQNIQKVIKHKKASIFKNNPKL